MRRSNVAWLVLTVFAATALVAGLGACRKESEETKEKTQKDEQPARERPGRAARPQRRPSPGAAVMSARQFVKKFKLPAEADGVVYLSLKGLREQPLWKKIGPAIQRSQPAQLVSAHCKLDITKLVDEAALAVSYQSRDSLTVVKGENLDPDKITACLQKAASNPKLKDTISVEAAGAAKGSKGTKGAKQKGGQSAEGKKGHKGKESAKGEKSAKGAKAARGRPAPKARPAATGKGPWRVHLTTDAGKVSFTLAKLGDHRMAISTGRWSKMPAQLAEGKKPAISADSHISKLHRSLAPVNLFWAASLGLPPEVEAKLPKVAAVQKIRSLGAGLEGRPQSAVIKLNVDMREEKNAASLAQVLKSQLPGLPKFLPALSQLSSILKKIEIKAEGPILRLSLELTEKDMQAIHGILQTVLKSGMLEASASRRKSVPGFRGEVRARRG